MADPVSEDPYAPVPLTAVFLNCTLKHAPEPSNTAALCRQVIGWYDQLDVDSEIIRPVDHDIAFGITSDEGEGDAWPGILERVLAADILVIGTPIWFGVRSSVAQLVIERLDGTYTARNDVGQYPLYNTVGGVVVTGNEDGAHAAAETTLFNLSHLGCTIPPNADTYWVGDAGPGPSYIEAGGQDHDYTRRTARWMAHNTVYLARLLHRHPIPAEGNTRDPSDEAHRFHVG